MGKASGTWEMLVGDTIHVLPKVAHEHGDCRKRVNFWASLGWMFADFDWVRWWLYATDIRWLITAAVGEHFPECLLVIYIRFFGVWGLFVSVVIVAD